MHDVIQGGRFPGKRLAFAWPDLAVAAACLVGLAMIALPRDWHSTTAVRRAEVAALAGSLASAAALGHSLWLADGAPATLELPRGTVRIVNGYPAESDLPRLLEPAETLAFVQEGSRWAHRDAHDCAVRYAPPARRGGTAAVASETEGC